MPALLLAPLGVGAATAQAQAAQPRTVTGRVTSEQGDPMGSVSVIIKGTSQGTMTRVDGNYTVRVAVGQILVFRLIGNAPEERTVGANDVINVTLRRVATQLDAMVVTALGQTAQVRTLGTSQQSVEGAAISETQRQNFVNALQGRVAGVEVTSSSGVPGASSSITIRGVSSISSSNQPLMVVDGLPLDNKTLNTGVLASDAPGSATAFSNRGVDFTNRAADINPDDIESLTVLKGPEASALYGIDAANGRRVRGRPPRQAGAQQARAAGARSAGVRRTAEPPVAVGHGDGRRLRQSRRRHRRRLRGNGGGGRRGGQRVVGSACLRPLIVTLFMRMRPSVRCVTNHSWKPALTVTRKSVTVVHGLHAFVSSAATSGFDSPNRPCTHIV